MSNENWILVQWKLNFKLSAMKTEFYHNEDWILSEVQWKLNFKSSAMKTEF
jgi:hypothetical protein